MPVETFRSTEVDEARAVVAATYAEMEIEPEHKSTFGVRTSFTNIGDITVALWSLQSRARIGLNDMYDGYGVGVPIRGTFGVLSGGSDFVADPTTAHVTSPGRPASLDGFGSAGDRLLTVRFDKQALHGHLRLLTGREAPSPVQFEPRLEMERGSGAQWRAIASTVASAIRAGEGFILNPLMSAPLASTILTGFLYSTEHGFRELIEAPHRSLHPYVVARALQIIDERPDQPLTVPGIASEVGCSVRALQVGFRRHLNMTPGQRLRQVRLDRIHTDLVAGAPDTTTVAATARRWGVIADGRFTASYQMIYGELPSVTLRGR